METTLGELIGMVIASFVETGVFMGDGAEKIVTFDWLNLKIGELIFTAFVIYITSLGVKDVRERWERHNEEAEEFLEAYNASPDSKTHKDMLLYFRNVRSEFAELSDAQILKTLKADYRVKWKIELWIGQFFQITSFYWLSLIVLFIRGVFGEMSG